MPEKAVGRASVRILHRAAQMPVTSDGSGGRSSSFDAATSTPPSPVERVQHLDDDERRQRHRRRLIVREYVAVDAAKALVLNEALRLVRLIRQRHRQRTDTHKNMLSLRAVAN